MRTEAQRESNTFSGAVLASDLHMACDLFSRFFQQVPSGAWHNLTEHRPGAWNLHQTLGHITLASTVYLAALESMVNDTPFPFDGLPARDGLTRFNYQNLEATSREPPAALAERFCANLHHTAELVAAASPELLRRSVTQLPWFKKLDVARLVAGQLAHPMVTHGAQLANGAGRPPLWMQVSPDVTHRLFTYFLCGQMAPYYNSAKGWQRPYTLGWIVGGTSGGRWHMHLGPDGAIADEGAIARPTLLTWSPGVDALLRIYTLQTGLARAILTGRIVAIGNLSLALRLFDLFLPPAVVSMAELSGR